LISFFTALFSTLLILFASRQSYKRYVEKSLQNIDNGQFGDDRDLIDKLDDPYDLYSEDRVEERSEKEIIKEEKSKVSLFKRKKEITKALPVNFSILRLLSYGFLVLGFIYLQESGKLNIAQYLIGVTVGIIGVSIFNFWRQRR
jgi:hypothetical protein